MRLRFLSALFLLSFFNGFAQDDAIESSSEFLRAQHEFEEKILNSLSGRADFDLPDTIVVPVVVHVMHIGEPIGEGTNVSDENIHAAVALANSLFANENGYGPDTQVRFRLATQDAIGCPHPGIIRVDMSANSDYATNGIVQSGCGGLGVPFSTLTAASLWPRSQYYNIYVVNNICGPTTSLAAFPFFLGSGNDHILIESQFMNGQNILLPRLLGRAMGLYYTSDGAFGCGADDFNCETTGDRVCDTDDLDDDICNTSFGCGSSTTQLNSMYNVMSKCEHPLEIYRITQGQKDRLRSVFCQEPRSSFLTSPGAGPITLGTIYNIVHNTCFNNCNGSISLSPQCGNTFTYLWNTGATTATIENLCNGTYSVVITNEDGITGALSFEVTSTPTLNVNTTLSDESCLGIGDGTLSIAVDGGTPWIYGQGTLFQAGDDDYPLPYNNIFLSTFAHLPQGYSFGFHLRDDQLEDMNVSEGYIHSIAFNVLELGNPNEYYNYTLRIINTDDYTFLHEMPDESLVFSRDTLTNTLGWNTLVFDRPFYYDGESHIFFKVCIDGSPLGVYEPAVVEGSLINDIFLTTGYNANPSSSSLSCSETMLFAQTQLRPNMKMQHFEDSVHYDLFLDGTEIGYFVDNLQSGQYTLTVRDQIGCEVNQIITIGIPDDVTLNILGSDTAFVSGVFVNNDFSYSVNPLSESPINWTVQNGTIVSGQGTSTITVAWNEQGIGVVSASQMVDDCVASQSFNVHVFGPCEVSGTIVHNVCNPEVLPIPLMQNAAVNGGFGDFQYEWSLPNNAPNIAQYVDATNEFQPSLISFFEGDTLELSLIITDVLGLTCASPIYIVNPCLNAEEFVVCSADALPMQIPMPDIFVGTAPYTYQWSANYFEGNEFVNAISFLDTSDPENVLLLNYLPEDTLTVRVEIYDSFGRSTRKEYACFGSCFSTTGASCNVFEALGGEAVQLCTNIETCNLPATYAWSNVENISAIDIPNPVLTVTESETICCNVTDRHGCTQSSCAEIVMLVNVHEEIVAAPSFNFFPNPTSANITIDHTFSFENQLQIYDLTGRVLMRETNIATQRTLDLSALSKGVYLIQLSDKSHQTSTPLILH